MLNIWIDNRINFWVADLPAGMLPKIKEKFRYNNPDYFRRKNMGFYAGNIPRVIATFKVHDDDRILSLPRGGMARLGDILDRFGVAYQIEDLRVSLEPVSYEFAKDFQPREYQTKAVQEIVKAETCLLEGAPASGKTEILLMAIAQVGLKTGIIVHDRNLLGQWVSRIEKRLGIPKGEIGVVGSGKFKLGDRITVMMQQTARNHVEKLKDQFGFLCADECHHFPANTFLMLADAFSARYRVGASATIKRQDFKHFLTYDLFGEIAYEIGRQELVDLGFAAPVHIHVVKTNFSYDYRNEDALRDHFSDRVMDYDDLSAEEKRKYEEQLGLPRKDYPQYLDVVSKDSDRNLLIYHVVRWEYDRGGRIIIFTKRREHCELWRDSLAKVGIECAILWGASGSKKEAKRIAKDLKRLRDGKIRIVIGTVLDEGINIPTVDASFVTYRNASNPGQLEQQAGRLARLFSGKEFGRLYYFHDQNIKSFQHDIQRLQKCFENVTVHENWKRSLTVKHD
jgi:superfamily II DNA or RNA helicase